METSRPAAPSVGTIAKTFTRILRFRRSTAGDRGCSSVGVVPDDDTTVVHKLKLSKDLSSYSAILSQPSTVKHDEKLSTNNREAFESLLANIFARISAVKATYAQMQVAQSPYDPETIQSADQVVVSEFILLSELKHAYLKKQLNPAAEQTLTAQIQEQRNLLKTYQITMRKLETDLQIKDEEVVALQAQLVQIDKQNRAMEARLHPGRSLAVFHDLHLSGLNPTHFLAALRYCVKSVRSFVKLMLNHMESAHWDLDVAAAAAVHPGMSLRKPGDRVFAFESFVFQKIFSNFQRRDYGLSAFSERRSWDCRRFFDEFSKLKLLKPRQLLEKTAHFCRAKYLGLVHPKMEAAFFGGLEQRGLVSSGSGFPDSKFFEAFAEMSSRVWLLHCLFFTFSDGHAIGEPVTIFQAPQGCNFSEVFMESVTAANGDDAVVRPPIVNFTVVPGFRVAGTVIQCKVYLS